jgi:hypothetical protein
MLARGRVSLLLLHALPSRLYAHGVYTVCLVQARYLTEAEYKQEASEETER